MKKDKMNSLTDKDRKELRDSAKEYVYKRYSSGGLNRGVVEHYRRQIWTLLELSGNKYRKKDPFRDEVHGLMDSLYGLLFPILHDMTENGMEYFPLPSKEDREANNIKDKKLKERIRNSVEIKRKSI